MKKTIQKLLSVVLVMAICISAVCACLITVNAADTSATYTITAESLHAYADEGKATMTFNLDSGFTSGSFTLLKDNASFNVNYDKEGNLIPPSPWNSEYGDVEIEVVGGTTVDGTALTADQMAVTIFNDTNNNGKNDAEEEGDVRSTNNALWYDTNGNYKDAEGNNFAFVPGVTEKRFETYRLSNISFNSGDVVYKSLTLEFKFEWDYCMQPNSKNEIIFAQEGQTDHLGNEYSAPVLKNGETSYVLSENVVEGNVNYFHSHCAKNIDTNTQLLQKNDYGVYSCVCDLCGKAGIQLFPDDIAGTKANAYYDIAAMNIVYEDDGTVSLNVHCPGFQGTKEKLVISYTNGKKTIYGDNKTSEIAGNTSMELSPYAKEKVIKDDGTFYYLDNVLPADTYMYVIKGLSAKDIGTKFYITRIVEGSGEQYDGKLFAGNTQEISLVDYCSGVVGGTKVYYPEGTTEAQIQADKAVAVAFINYGTAAANALNHKVSYEKEEIKVTDTWDGTKQEPTTKDEAGNIIINTAEELAWVALASGTATAGNNYKVAANSVFDMMGMEGITLDSTVAQVKAAVKKDSNKWQTPGDNQSNAFQGNFDGNGLIVYNLYTATGRAYGGLFPFAKPATSTTPQVIKNVSVYASHIGGYHYAGGIVGLAECNTTSSIVNFEGCIVKNSYIFDNDDPNATNRTVGTIVGGLSHNGFTINNCAAIDNQLSAQGITGGLAGNKSDYGGSITITNSFSIGTSVLPTAGTKTVSVKFASATYKNVYTDVETSTTGITVLDTANMKGSAAETNMSGLDWNSVWVTTDLYPEFNPDVYCTDVWDGTKVEPTATDAEGNIIISSAEELAWVALQGGSATNGKNYKVADGIKYFNMNGSVGITADSTVSDVKAATATTNLWNHSADFTGNFDGNGVVVYNIRNATGQAYGGLFPRINGVNSSIKNVTVKASIIYAYHGAGAILGQGSGQFTTTIDNCAVENCYMTDNNNTNTGCQRSAGIFVGSSANHCIKINNCFAAGNECSGVHSYGGFVGRASAWAPGNFTFTNCVSLGISPYTTAGAGAIGDDIAVKATWTNVYTDTDLPSGASTNAVNGIKKLTTAQMTGEAAKDNMPALAWGAEWFEGKTGEYPSINGEVYADTWDGTFSEPTETDVEGNIIIRTAEQMAWVALRGAATTAGKSYKVAEGIKYFNMSGATGITANSTAAEVRAATKTTNYWRYAADGGKDYAFQGNFDGNGVTIYNIYAYGYGHGALFPYVYNDSNIENVTVKASFISGYHNAAGIVGSGELTKTININKCAVENCYITDNGSTNTACKRAASQFIASTGNSNVNISNCLAANNTVSAAGYEAGFVATTGEYQPKGTSITNSISIGVYPYSNAKIGSLGKGLNEKLTVQNVYSDVACDVAEGFITINADDAKGEGAANKIPSLAWGIDWFTGKPGEHPTFVDDGVKYVPDEIYELLAANGYYSNFIANFDNTYNRDNFTTSDENCNFYATGLTLKTNPYMTVTFAFLDKYSNDKANVEAVFTVNGQTITVKGSEMVNNEGAGRYHMVRLKDIDVASLCDDITVTLKYNGTQIGTGSISVAGFGFTAADAGDGFEYYETAAQALVFYAETLQNKIAVTTWPQ